MLRRHRVRRPQSPQLSDVVVPSTLRGVLAGPGRVWAASAAAVCVAIVVLAIVWTMTETEMETSLSSRQKFDVAAIPMIGAARATLLSYPEQPDYKAVAISGYAVGVAFASTSREAAETEALERCKARTDLSSSGPGGLLCRRHGCGVAAEIHSVAAAGRLSR